MSCEIMTKKPRKGSLLEAILNGEKPTNFLSQPMTVAFENFVSPIDGSVITSKHAIKEHEKKHNVVHVGSDLEKRGNNGLTREQSKQKQNGANND